MEWQLAAWCCSVLHDRARANAEFRLAMIGCGTTTLKAIAPAGIIDTGSRG